jgi:hypothetical protein
MDELKSQTPGIDIYRHENIPKSQALHAMSEADWLLMLIPDKLAGYIPGKLYDYLSRRRTILVYGHEGETSRIVEKTHAGVVIAEGAINALNQILQRTDHQVSDNSDLQQFLGERSRRQQAKRLFQELDGLYDKPASACLNGDQAHH